MGTAQALSNNNWNFLYSQITGGEIGQQCLFDSQNGLTMNPTYGNGLAQFTDTGTISTDKVTDNFYELIITINNLSSLSSESAVLANFFGQEQNGSNILLGFMSRTGAGNNPSFLINGWSDVSTYFHTLLFNTNFPNSTGIITLEYYDETDVLLANDTINIADISVGGTCYIHTMRQDIDGLPWAKLNLTIIRSANYTTNIVGFLKTSHLITPENLVCFGAGSMVFTPCGEVPIENLKQGDMVYDENLTPQLVEFIAKRTIIPSKSANKYSVPILITKGKLGENLPCRDTIVSSAHLIKYNDQMVPASSLGVNADVNTPITFYNVKVSNYSTMIVNGMVSETLDTTNDSKVYAKVY